MLSLDLHNESLDEPFKPFKANKSMSGINPRLTLNSVCTPDRCDGGRYVVAQRKTILIQYTL
jgi:hypothetical protein